MVYTLLLYSLDPYRWTDRQTDRQTEKQIHLLHVGWWNLSSSCAVVSVIIRGGGKMVAVDKCRT